MTADIKDVMDFREPGPEVTPEGKPIDGVMTFDFLPKYAPYQKVRCYYKGKKKEGMIVDCIGVFIVSSTPRGVVIGVDKPNEQTTHYLVTFDGNVNNAMPFTENFIEAIDEK